MAIKKNMSKNKNVGDNKLKSVIDDKIIKEYADMFSLHNLTLLKITSGKTKITLKKVDNRNRGSVAQQISSIPIQEDIITQNTIIEKKEEIKNTELSDYLKIVSPISGTFYTSPSPDASPYVKEGDTVAKDTVVCIVEAMKMMNEIKAQINGKIVRILVDNNTAVEVGDTLFLVEP